MKSSVWTLFLAMKMNQSGVDDPPDQGQHPMKPGPARRALKNGTRESPSVMGQRRLFLEHPIMKFMYASKKYLCPIEYLSSIVESMLILLRSILNLYMTLILGMILFGGHRSK